MKSRQFLTAILGAMLVACAAAVAADGNAPPPGRPMGPGPMMGPGMRPGAPFERYYAMISEQNMLPGFALTDDQKQKFQDLRKEWGEAQQKYLQENKDEAQKIGEVMRAARKDQDMEKMKDAAKQMQEFMSKGPKAQEYVAKAKAILTADQAKTIDDKIQQMDEARKAREEQGKEGGHPEGNENPK